MQDSDDGWDQQSPGDVGVSHGISKRLVQMIMMSHQIRRKIQDRAVVQTSSQGVKTKRQKSDTEKDDANKR